MAAKSEASCSPLVEPDRENTEMRCDELEVVEMAALEESSSGKENTSSSLKNGHLQAKLDEKSRENGKKTDVQPEHKLQLCYACKSTLAKSPELISVAGQAHKWHPECFMCSICCEPMDKCQSCHLFKGQIVCRNDYIKLKRNHQTRPIVKCARCRWPIGQSDWVRRAASFVYHLACFNCDTCFRQLNTGDQFTLIAHNSGAHNSVRLLCRYHFSIDDANSKSSTNFAIKLNQIHSKTSGCQLHDNMNLFANCSLASGQQFVQSLVGELASESISPGSSAPANASGTSNTNSNLTMIDPSKSTNSNNTCHQQPINTDYDLQLGGNSGDQRNQSCGSSSSSMSPSLSTSSSPQSATMQAPTSLMLIHSASGSSSSAGNCMQSSSSSSSTKSKRVRTTFTDDQLSILQTHFQIDSNPDGQDLERIATITGLSKRVTQVWFQNSRARQKKYLVKKKPLMIHDCPTTADLSTARSEF